MIYNKSDHPIKMYYKMMKKDFASKDIKMLYSN